MTAIPLQIRRRIRFEQVSERADLGPCWIWTGRRAHNGYGRVKFAGRDQAVHRITYELVNGPIPDGLEPDHLCRIRACCRPDHLEPVTHVVNCRRGGFAARSECAYGHPYTEGSFYIRVRPSCQERVCLACQRDRNAGRPRIKRLVVAP